MCLISVQMEIMACTIVYIALLAQNRYLQITHWTEREDDKIDASKTVFVQRIFGIQLDISYKTVGTEIFEIKHELMCLIFFSFYLHFVKFIISASFRGQAGHTKLPPLKFTNVYRISLTGFLHFTLLLSQFLLSVDPIVVNINRKIAKKSYNVQGLYRGQLSGVASGLGVIPLVLAYHHVRYIILLYVNIAQSFICHLYLLSIMLNYST